jgi:type I restriction enzyme M protein
VNRVSIGLFPLQFPPPCCALQSTWGGKNPDGRWRCFTYDELSKRDKLNLDIFWIKDKSLEDAENLPEPDELAREIADDLETALEQFRAIANGLKG